jgi:hypothetical protein
MPGVPVAPAARVTAVVQMRLPVFPSLLICACQVVESSGLAPVGEVLLVPDLAAAVPWVGQPGDIMAPADMVERDLSEYTAAAALQPRRTRAQVVPVRQVLAYLPCRCSCSFLAATMNYIPASGPCAVPCTRLLVVLQRWHAVLCCVMPQASPGLAARALPSSAP